MRLPPLDGRVAIVTGAARGIGFAIASRLATDGAAICLFDKDADALARAVRSLAAERVDVTAHEVDVTVEEAVRSAIRDVADRRGHVDVLVNNAGVYPHTPFERLTFAEWRRVLATNLDSAFLCAHAVFPVMKSGGHGRIVNISSAAFHVGEPDMTHYVASKAGLIGFTRALARSGGPYGITVNAITPGFIETAGVADDPAELALFETIVAQQAVARRGQPADIAECVAYLARTEAGFITGQTVNVDGGHRFW
jgi:3-oxoacyl-[acyl-carrier protein] reductase